MPHYSMDMSQEQESQSPEIFAEGWHDFEVVSMEEMTSKQGNQMFKISLALADNPTKGIIVYAIATQGKRWFLKQLLNACDCQAGQDGVYNFDTEEIIGKTVSGRVANINEEWKDKTGKARTSVKSKVVEFDRMGVKEPEEEGPDL